MDPEKQEESQQIQWTIVIQCFKEGENPPIYKIVMRYYGDNPAPVLRCETAQTEWNMEE